MNYHFFNEPFLNWEQQYEIIKIKEQEQEQADMLKIANFQKTFPDLSFGDLEGQKRNHYFDIPTIYYKHNSNGAIYVYNLNYKSWEEVPENRQGPFLNLFI
jgi:hypothetical protein